MARSAKSSLTTNSGRCSAAGEEGEMKAGRSRALTHERPYRPEEIDFKTGRNIHAIDW
jgi:hypothetical protein